MDHPRRNHLRNSEENTFGIIRVCKLSYQPNYWKSLVNLSSKVIVKSIENHSPKRMVSAGPANDSLVKKEKRQKVSLLHNCITTSFNSIDFLQAHKYGCSTFLCMNMQYSVVSVKVSDVLPWFNGPGSITSRATIGEGWYLLFRSGMQLEMDLTL